MTFETTTELPPEEVLDLAREFFTGSDAPRQAAVTRESEGHIVFSTFRSQVAVAAFPDPEGEAPTRVRVSTLRDDTGAAKFITYVNTAVSPGRATSGTPSAGSTG